MGVGTNLKRLRSKTKLSQQEIADMLGLDRNTYTNWENETTISNRSIFQNWLKSLKSVFLIYLIMKGN